MYVKYWLFYQITFLVPQGPQPSISIIKGGGLSSHQSHDISVRYNGQFSLIALRVYSYRSARTEVPCSNRGVCDYNTGTCTCYDGYQSSNGQGKRGTRGDCGYRFSAGPFTYTTDNTTEALVITSCPFVNNAICAGRGSCEESTGICTCDTGYGKITSTSNNNSSNTNRNDSYNAYSNR